MPPRPLAPLPSAAHERRLRDVWRSAGWPCLDAIEAELLAGGWLERRHDAEGRETLRVTEAGVHAIAAAHARHRARRNAHEALVERVAREMRREGRVVWRALALRAPIDGGWVVAMPDVFSIRHTTVESRVEPIAHEIKVRRADLLADLRRPAKATAYAALASRCWYVLAAGIADPDEIPAAYGVMLAHGDRLEVARPAPARAFVPTLAMWMALARAAPEPFNDDAQGQLHDPRDDDVPR